MSYIAPHIKPSHRGMLHEEMGVPEGKKIGIGALMKKKSQAKREGDTALEKRVIFAQNARKWHHG